MVFSAFNVTPHSTTFLSTLDYLFLPKYVILNTCDSRRPRRPAEKGALPLQNPGRLPGAVPGAGRENCE